MSSLSRVILSVAQTVRPKAWQTFAPRFRTMSSLSRDEVARYSRQLLLPEIGAGGQAKLKATSVLVVGCGGLGCPAALYLAAAGIGRLGLVDNDLVELSNLHRQVLHNEARVGTLKTASAVEALKPFNSNVTLEPINVRLSAENALDIVSKYDIVLDGTDNAMARYLLSDVCVLAKKPLVSGAALRFNGQLIVYNYDSDSPCYRCLFPNPPPPGTVTNCSDGGVLGVIPGIIGSLQALEAIKIAIGQKPTYSSQMLLFDGLEGGFKNIKMRGKKEDCISCGKNPTIGPHLIDYHKFVGVAPCAPGAPATTGLKILAPEERVTCIEYKEQVVDKNEMHLLLDVRPKLQADIIKLEKAINVPLEELTKVEGLEEVEDMITKAGVSKVFVMCRKGNASQKAVRLLKDHLKQHSEYTEIEIKDIIGGIEAWSKEVDPTLPMY